MVTVRICERFEPRSHFKSRLSLIVRVNVVVNRTVFVDSDQERKFCVGLVKIVDV